MTHQRSFFLHDQAGLGQPGFSQGACSSSPRRPEGPRWTLSLWPKGQLTGTAHFLSDVMGARYQRTQGTVDTVLIHSTLVSQSLGQSRTALLKAKHHVHITQETSGQRTQIRVRTEEIQPTLFKFLPKQLL